MDQAFEKLTQFGYEKIFSNAKDGIAPDYLNTVVFLSWVSKRVFTLLFKCYMIKK